MTEPTEEPPVAVVYGEPIPLPVVEEVVQLLGYEWRDVAQVVIGGRQVGVTTASVIDHEIVDTVHRHTIV